MEYTFTTPEPTTVYVEFGSGALVVEAADVAETKVEVTGDRAEEVVVEQRGHQIGVVAPKRTGFFSRGNGLRIAVSLPTDSELVTKLGSADINAIGRLGWVKLQSGSGDITLEEVSAEAAVKTGSGDIRVSSVSGAAELQTGSGDVEVDQVAGPTEVKTGSGDITIGHAASPLALKSGSGSLTVRSAAGDTVLSTASGDVRVGTFPSGQLTAKNASGDIRVGIPAGVPVWTDVTSVTGRIRSNLESTGAPGEGQDYVELRANTVSGDVTLEQV
jgi:DUF4097 and DUF4098 domain-containing protein YvlB